MLSREDNDLITQTNPGTPMGNVIARYWVSRPVVRGDSAQ